MLLKIACGDELMLLCNLLFLSFQIMYTVAWTTNLRKDVGDTESFSHIQQEKAFQKINPNGLYPSLCITESQIFSLTSHLKKRWSLVSSNVLYKQHLLSI